MALKIVFIDDEEDLCEIYKDLLESSEREIVTFTDALEAIQYIKDNSVNICFLDYRMPQMNGQELRKQISHEIPCILLTGELNIDSMDGFKEVLKKPLNLELFEKTIAKYS